MPHKRIAIVGASVRAASASAVRAGFDVAAADLFADEDLRSIAAATQIHDYPAGFAGWLRELRPRPAAWMYTGAIENHPELVDELATVALLWGNAGDALRQVRSPWLVSETLRQAGLLFPETRDRPDGLPRDGSWLAKTGRGGSGSGVAAFLGQTQDSVLDQRVFYQQRVSGTHCSGVFVAAAGSAELLGIVKQLVGEPWLHAREFQYCGAISPWPVSGVALAAIRQIGEVLASRFALRGLFGIDFMLDGDRVWVVEVNPRYAASSEIVELATGVNSIAAHALACLKDTLTAVANTSDRMRYGKAILFARRTFAVTARINAILRNAVARVPTTRPPLCDVPRLGTRIAKGHPVLTVVAAGASADEVVAELKCEVATVETQLYL